MGDSGDAAVAGVLRAIVDVADPDFVYLFGSRARGDAHDSSDIDIAVVKSFPGGDACGRGQVMEVALCQIRSWRAQPRRRTQ